MVSCIMLSVAVSDQLQIEDLNEIAKMRFHKTYNHISDLQKQKVKSNLEKKLKIIALAMRDGLDETEAFKKKFENAKKSILIKMYLKQTKEHIQISQQEIEKYYVAHMTDYTTVHAFTIVRNSKKKLLECIEILNKSPKNEQEKTFKTLAKKYSQHPRKRKGGDLGFIGYNAMVQPFGKVAFQLKEGTFTQKPIKTTLGYHLIYVSQKQTKPLEKVQNNIETILRQRKYKAWLEGV